MRKMMVLVVFAFTQVSFADFASELLQASDFGRGGFKKGVSWKSKVVSVEDGETNEREFNVRSLDHDAYVEALSPARSRGEIYIFNDRNMWFYKPSLRKPLAISPRQKLSGQAANGDIASTHYARDYGAVLERTENLKGEKVHVLLLTAKSNNLTYDQIRYWIVDRTKLAIKAEFLTLQGKAFKIGEMEYQNQIKIDGKVVPFVSRLTVVDAQFPENKSIIEYTAPTLVDLPSSLFNVNNLSR